MASKCVITFNNNPLGVYYAGQIVSGTAELTTTRPKTIRSVYITISGFAEVRWTEDVTKQDTHGKPQKTIETFSGTEMYYSSEKYVYGQSGGLPLELAAGSYSFPFEATIPPNVPTSFNGAWGQIQHQVTLVIDRVMRYNNTFVQAYSVISPYDLNLNPENAQPLHKVDEKTFCWSLCCGTKGPLVMTVDVPFAAYAPGQKLRFKIVLDNQSDVHCSDVKVRLMKKVIYTSRSPEIKTQMTEIKVADNHCGEVIKHNKAEFNEYLQIPSTTPTSLEGCSIIKVSYTLKFIAKVSRIHRDLVIEFPFTIGTVPLYASTIEPAGTITAQPSNGPNYKPLPPPMFEEDLRSEQFESNTFKPRYPVFLNDAALSSSATTNDPPKTPKLPAGAVAVYPPNPKPTVLLNPIPNAQPMPSSQPSPRLHINPMPSSPPSVPYPNPKPADGGLEVLGFSVPPDYQPTPTAPASNNVNIGWK